MSVSLSLGGSPGPSLHSQVDSDADSIIDDKSSNASEQDARGSDLLVSATTQDLVTPTEEHRRHSQWSFWFDEDLQNWAPNSEIGLVWKQGQRFADGVPTDWTISIGKGNMVRVVARGAAVVKLLTRSITETECDYSLPEMLSLLLNNKHLPKDGNEVQTVFNLLGLVLSRESLRIQALRNSENSVEWHLYFHSIHIFARVLSGRTQLLIMVHSNVMSVKLPVPGILVEARLDTISGVLIAKVNFSSYGHMLQRNFYFQSDQDMDEMGIHFLQDQDCFIEAITLPREIRLTVEWVY